MTIVVQDMKYWFEDTSDCTLIDLCGELRQISNRHISKTPELIRSDNKHTQTCTCNKLVSLDLNRIVQNLQISLGKKKKKTYPQSVTEKSGSCTALNEIW